MARDGPTIGSFAKRPMRRTFVAGEYGGKVMPGAEITPAMVDLSWRRAARHADVTMPRSHPAQLQPAARSPPGRMAVAALPVALQPRPRGSGDQVGDSRAETTTPPP